MKHVGKILLFVLAIASWWLAFIQTPEKMPVPQVAQHKIDYYLKNFTVLSMDEQGFTKQKLRATYLEHFSDDDTTELELPRLTIYSEDKPNLNINADKGFLSSDAELAILNGVVKIRRQGTKDLAPLSIDTHNLHVQLTNNFAETDEFVKIISGTHTIQGNGLRAYFREPINIKILANVRGHHDIK